MSISWVVHLSMTWFYVSLVVKARISRRTMSPTYENIPKGSKFTRTNEVSRDIGSLYRHTGQPSMITVALEMNITLHK